MPLPVDKDSGLIPLHHVIAVTLLHTVELKMPPTQATENIVVREWACAKSLQWCLALQPHGL